MINLNTIPDFVFVFWCLYMFAGMVWLCFIRKDKP
jgi:hypothetical protein